MSEPRAADVIVVGGGVIGLTAAWRLAEEGRSVALLERGELGREASWAGAGILNPGDETHAATAWDRLLAMSSRLHAEWAGPLAELTGIDTGWRRCGGLHVAWTAADEVEIARLVEARRAENVPHQEWDQPTRRREEPHLAGDLSRVVCFPDAAQVRNPRHVRALAAACARRGVRLMAGMPVTGLLRSGSAITGVRTPLGDHHAAVTVVAAGAWSAGLAAEAGVTLRSRPVRGQIVLLNTAVPLLQRIVECGARYLVPRPDGRLLIGSTEEDVGFRPGNTAAGVESLLAFARRLVPASGAASFERAWSGLRPGNPDGRPYIGAVPGRTGLLVAAGHFRNGLQASTGTAQVIADLVAGRRPAVALEDFRPGRSAMPETDDAPHAR